MSFLLDTQNEAKLEIAKRLKRLRLYHNWSRETLALRSGISPSTLKKFEQTGDISLERLLKLASALGKMHSFNQLFEIPEAHNSQELKRQEEASERKRGTDKNEY